MRVDEAPPLSLGLGVGYDSEDGPAGQLPHRVRESRRAQRSAIAFQARVSDKENHEVLTRAPAARLRKHDRHARLAPLRDDGGGFLLVEPEGAVDPARAAGRSRGGSASSATAIQDVSIFDITDAPAALEQIFEDKLSNVRLADIGLGLGAGHARRRLRHRRAEATDRSRASVFAKPLGSEAYVRQAVRARVV